MKIGSLCALLAALGSAALVAACSSDDKKENPSPDSGPASGGKGGSSGGKGTGGAAAGGRGDTDAEVASGGARSSGGSPSTGGKSGQGSGGQSIPDAGNDSGSDAGLDCAFPRCRPPYPEVPHPAKNLDSDEKALLGKILFWEEQIGQLDTMACGTCHRSASGGSDPRTNVAAAKLKGPNGVYETQPDALSDDLRVAQGVPVCDIGGLPGTGAVQTTGRKPPTYLDAMFAPQIFWDGRAGFCKGTDGPGGCFYDPDLPASAPPLLVGDPTNTGTLVGGALEAQASGPPVNSAEMACTGRTWAAIAAKLTTAQPLKKALPGTIPTAMKEFIAANGNSYPNMFAAVYGADPLSKVSAADADSVINTRRIVFAIATHERRLTSNRTPWDLWNDGTQGHANALTAAQIAGFKLYMGKARCSSCHPPPLFTDNTFHNIGFHKPSWDIGRQGTTGLAVDVGRFKTPTLRNVGLRENFGLLHEGDGPGHSLDTVVALYNSRGKPEDPEILPHIDSVMDAPLGLTTAESAQLLDFLRNGLTDPRVKAEAFPFDRPKLGTEK